MQQEWEQLVFGELVWAALYISNFEQFTGKCSLVEVSYKNHTIQGLGKHTRHSQASSSKNSRITNIFKGV